MDMFGNMLVDDRLVSLVLIKDCQVTCHGCNREFSNERKRVEKQQTYLKQKTRREFTTGFLNYFDWVSKAGGPSSLFFPFPPNNCFSRKKIYLTNERLAPNFWYSQTLKWKCYQYYVSIAVLWLPIVSSNEQHNLQLYKSNAIEKWRQTGYIWGTSMLTNRRRTWCAVMTFRIVLDCNHG